VDVTLWVEQQRIAVLRDEMLGPWSMGEVLVELPGSPKMVSAEGKMMLVLMRGDERLGILAVVEPAAKTEGNAAPPQGDPPRLELP
jgi:hypothetical protein